MVVWLACARALASACAWANASECDWERDSKREAAVASEEEVAEVFCANCYLNMIVV